jgi:polysaccharide transporter, PST family
MRRVIISLRSMVFNGMWIIIKGNLRSSVIRNALSLYVINFANYLLPLITVPYVLRVLNPSGYGLVAFGQSFVGYFTVVIEYGFVYSATRKISVVRNDSAAVSRIVFSVWSAKLLLFLIGLLVLLPIVHLVPVLRENQTLLIILYGVPLGNVLFPTWLFQGMERMVNITMINLLIRFSIVIGIFTLIKRPEDYLLYASLSSVGSIAAGLIGAAWAIYLFSLQPVVPSLLEIRRTLQEGWMIFLSMASISLYTGGNAFILGMLTNSTVVGYYSAAEKIVQAFLSLIGPVAQAVYPRFSKMATDSKSLFLLWIRRFIFLMGGLGLALSIILFLAAPLIVNIFLGVQYERTIIVIRVLALLPFFIAVGNVLGIQIMLPFGKDMLFTMVSFGAGLTNIFLAFVLAPFCQETGMAIAVLVSEILVTLSLFVILSIYELNPLVNWNRAGGC